MAFEANFGQEAAADAGDEFGEAALDAVADEFLAGFGGPEFFLDFGERDASFVGRKIFPLGEQPDPVPCRRAGKPGNGTNFKVISCSSLASAATGPTLMVLPNWLPSGNATSTSRVCSFLLGLTVISPSPKEAANWSFTSAMVLEFEVRQLDFAAEFFKSERGGRLGFEFKLDGLVDFPREAWRREWPWGARVSTSPATALRSFSSVLFWRRLFS